MKTFSGDVDTIAERGHDHGDVSQRSDHQNVLNQ